MKSEQPWELTSGPLPIKENHVEEACTDLLNLRGYWWLRVHVGKYRTMDLKRVITAAEAGTPDYLVARGFRCFLMEVKAPGEKPSQIQCKKIEVLGTHFGLPIVIVDGVERLAEWLVYFESHYGRWAPSGRLQV